MSNRKRMRPSWKRLRNSCRLIKQLESEGWYLSDIKGDHDRDSDYGMMVPSHKTAHCIFLPFVFQVVLQFLGLRISVYLTFSEWRLHA